MEVGAYLAVVCQNGNCLALFKPQVVGEVTSHIQDLGVVDVLLDFVEEWVVEAFGKKEQGFFHKNQGSSICTTSRRTATRSCKEDSCILSRTVNAISISDEAAKMRGASTSWDGSLQLLWFLNHIVELVVSLEPCFHHVLGSVIELGAPQHQVSFGLGRKLAVDSVQFPQQ